MNDEIMKKHNCNGNCEFCLRWQRCVDNEEPRCSHGCRADCDYNYHGTCMEGGEPCEFGDYESGDDAL